MEMFKSWAHYRNGPTSCYQLNCTRVQFTLTARTWLLDCFVRSLDEERRTTHQLHGAFSYRPVTERRISFVNTNLFIFFVYLFVRFYFVIYSFYVVSFISPVNSNLFYFFLCLFVFAPTVNINSTLFAFFHLFVCLFVRSFYFFFLCCFVFIFYVLNFNLLSRSNMELAEF